MINSNANIGDKLFYRRRGKWSVGWTIEQVHTNQYGVVSEVTARNKRGVSRQIPLYPGGNDLVYVIPPREEVAGYLKRVKTYPNLVPVRRFSHQPPAYDLLCLNCRSILGLVQTYSEVSDIVLYKGRIQTSKPQIADGVERTICTCQDAHDEYRTYDLGEIDGYY